MRITDFIAAWLLLAPLATHAQQSLEPNLTATSPDLLASQCFGCHGPDGISQGPASPSIAGLDKGYIINAMLAYKYGADKAAAEAGAYRAGLTEFDFFYLRRPSTIMDRIAAGYTDEQLAAVSDYFSRRPYIRNPQPADPIISRLGKRLHEIYCEDCHEEGGRVSDSGSGVLAGQWMPYLRQTIADYQTGARHMSKKMAKKMKMVRAKDFEALINYYGSQ